MLEPDEPVRMLPFDEALRRHRKRRANLKARLARFGNPIDTLALDAALRLLDARKRRRRAVRLWLGTWGVGVLWVAVMAGLLYGLFGTR